MFTTRYAYDTLTNTTVITYNALGQKTGMLDPDMGTWRYRYNSVGSLISQTDSLGQRTLFGYDVLNRLITKTYSSTINLTGPVTYTYGSLAPNIGYRLAMTDTSGSTAWAYDTRGRVTQETKVIGGVPGSFATSFGYDTLDRVVTTTLPTGEVVTQTYNNMGALENVRSINAAQSFNMWYAPNLDYNANGSVARIDLGNTLSTTYAYDPLNFRLTAIKTGKGTLLQNLAYAYDPVGNVKTITDTVNSGQVITFTYDALDRLASAKTTAAGTGQYFENYTYNPIGNLTVKAGAQQWYSDTAHVHAASTVITGGLKFTQTYDANGNTPALALSCDGASAGCTTRKRGASVTKHVELIGSQRITYTQQWDAENRLTVVTNTISGQVTKFVYDGDGARVLQLLPDTSKTAYAGALEVSITGTLRITKTYYSAGQLVAMRVVTSTGGNTLYYLHTDHLGSASLTTNATGGEVSRQNYYPYGAIRSVGTMPTDIGFTGQRAHDSNLGSLMFYQARYYSPSLGRFLSADTIVSDLSSPQDLNRYAYGLNNPVKYIDPTGHATCEDMSWECDDEGNWLDDDVGLPNNPIGGQIDPLEGMYDTGYDYGAVHAEGETDADDLLHPGIDAYGRRNTNGVVVVRASASGFIHFRVVANNRGFGNYAILMVPDGYGNYYQLIFAHMRDDNTNGLDEGAWVNVGDPIGIVGHSGNADGDHLHYEVRHDPYFRVTDTGFTSDNPNLQGIELYYPRRDVFEQGVLFIDPWLFPTIYIPQQPVGPMQ